MKNVGIITLPLSNYNYGGILQAYALQRFITERYNINVTHINREYNTDLLLRAKTFIYNLQHRASREAFKSYVTPIDNFIGRNIILSKPIRSPHQFHQFLKSRKIDLLITGSDQVWNQNYTYNISDDLLLNIPYKCTKISYAASFGTNDYAGQDSAEKIRMLNGISVREQSAQQYLDGMGIISHHHIDPTMLLSADHYRKIASESDKDFSGGVTVYLLDDNSLMIEACGALAQSSGKRLNIIGKKLRAEQISVIRPSQKVDAVPDWLKAFAEADYIVTDSFHGCVFAILFNKQFVTFGNAARGIERFQSLLSIFDLGSRLITTSKQIEGIFNPINYEAVNKKVEILRSDAEQYLRHFINE